MRSRALAEAVIKTGKIDAEILVRLLTANFVPNTELPPQDSMS